MGKAWAVKQKHTVLHKGEPCTGMDLPGPEAHQLQQEEKPAVGGSWESAGSFPKTETVSAAIAWFPLVEFLPKPTSPEQLICGHSAN